MNSKYLPIIGSQQCKPTCALICACLTSHGSLFLAPSPVLSRVQQGWHAFPNWVSVNSSPNLVLLTTSDCRPWHNLTYFLFLTNLNNLLYLGLQRRFPCLEDSILLILQFGSLPSCDAFLALWIRCIPQYYGGLLSDIFTV